MNKKEFDELLQIIDPEAAKVVYDRIREYRSSPSDMSDEEVYSSMKYRGTNHCIYRAFAWSKTPEGHVYWSTLNRKFVKTYKEWKNGTIALTGQLELF